jgi:hypothetical protein
VDAVRCAIEFQRFKPRSDVHTIAIEVATFDDCTEV